jgi:hypothetical protein
MTLAKTLQRAARIALIGAAALSLGLTSGAFAQESTGEIIPGSECTAKSRPIDFLGTLLATPESTEPYEAPTAVPDGEEVSPEVRAELEATVRQFVACSNSGEVLRALSLLGDDYLRRVFDPNGKLSRDTADKLIQSVATPVAIAEDKLVVFIGIREMVQLADGRVAVVIETDGGDPNPEGTDVDLFIFEKIGDQWIVYDAVNDIDDLEAKAAD